MEIIQIHPFEYNLKKIIPMFNVQPGILVSFEGIYTINP